MNKISNKVKIIIAIIVFIVVAAVMFLYGYGVLSARNQIAADEVAKQRLELEVLEREQKSFEQGKKDLAQLEESNHPPDELFSKDTKVVNEIQQLEAAAQRYNLNLEISVTGTTKTAVKAVGALTELFVVPYQITLDGDFSNMLSFIQTAEHMPFVTHVNELSISVAAENEARTTLTSVFYIKK